MSNTDPVLPDPTPSQRELAFRTIVAALSLDIIFGICFGMANHIGIWNGLYFATTTATTVGYGDVIPRGWLPHLLAVLIMITVIPLFAATYSLFTSSLMTNHVLRHVKSSEQRIKKHIEKHSGVNGAGSTVPADRLESYGDTPPDSG